MCKRIMDTDTVTVPVYNKTCDDVGFATLRLHESCKVANRQRNSEYVGFIEELIIYSRRTQIKTLYKELIKNILEFSVRYDIVLVVEIDTIQATLVDRQALIDIFRHSGFKIEDNLLIKR